MGRTSGQQWWMRGGLVAATALTGMAVAATGVHADPGEATPPASASQDTLFQRLQTLPAELRMAILQQMPGCPPAYEKLVVLDRVCRELHQITGPLLKKSLRVVHTPRQLAEAFADPQVTAIVLIPTERITLETAPNRFQDHIFLHDTRPVGQGKSVAVKGTLRVKASGTADVEAWDNSQVTASGDARVWTWNNSQVTATGTAHVQAWDNSQVTASGNAFVEAGDESRVTASGDARVQAYRRSRVIAFDQAAVLVVSREATVTGHGPTVQIVATKDTKIAVTKTIDASPCQIVSQKKLRKLEGLGYLIDNGTW